MKDHWTLSRTPMVLRKIKTTIVSVKVLRKISINTDPGIEHQTPFSKAQSATTAAAKAFYLNVDTFTYKKVKYDS